MLSLKAQHWYRCKAEKMSKLKSYFIRERSEVMAIVWQAESQTVLRRWFARFYYWSTAKRWPEATLFSWCHQLNWWVMWWNKRIPELWMTVYRDHRTSLERDRVGIRATCWVKAYFLYCWSCCGFKLGLRWLITHK